MLIFSSILAFLSISITAAGKPSQAERFAACGPAAKVIGFVPPRKPAETGVIHPEREDGVIHAQRENGIIHNRANPLISTQIVGGTNAREISEAADDHAERENGIIHNRANPLISTQIVGGTNARKISEAADDHADRENGIIHNRANPLISAQIVGGTNAREISEAADDHAERENGIIHNRANPLISTQIVGGTNARETGEAADEIEGRQTCTQCPCANGSIQCFCSNTPGERGNSLFIPSCSNSVLPSPNSPIAADCMTLAALMVTGAPVGSSLNFPVKTNGYYNIPVESALIWEFQGCGFGFFNNIDSSYNICATDLANSVKALVAYCPTVDSIEAQFQNDPSRSLVVYNPAE
ncbi:hypothetical protein MSAN_01240400 [Mycena sanguinolenta]|uniref:Uncharacterized protein n=1 Tax=Mycena sanguinolenta TaxID=230812 RepID=A0A8H6YDC0_9AGAR|nr:hypothetical protein MSAN_01240400 [Mycena sanguinolenta]